VGSAQLRERVIQLINGETRELISEKRPAFLSSPDPMLNRHPGVRNLMRWLTPNPKLPDDQRQIAQECHQLADSMLTQCWDGPELTEGLRKLLEAKDCFVRASLPDEPSEPNG
jgi:hypothetical protein